MFGFHATNNEPEYKTSLAGLRLARDLKIVAMEIYCDSLLVVCQVRREYQAKDRRLAAYLSRVHKILDEFDYYTIYYILRESNPKVDSLAKLASLSEAQQMGLVPVETLSSTSINQMEIDRIFEVVLDKESWMNPFRNYLEHGILPERRSEKRQILRKASRFTIQNGVIYRRGYSIPLLRCISHNEIKRVLRDVHEGECGDHIEG